MKRAPRISEAEWEVMKFVWRSGSATAQDAVAALGPERDWSAATVKTLLNRLHSKGALRFRKTGKSYVYFPVHTEQELRSTEVDSFLSRVFDGAVTPMIAHFAHAKKLSEHDLNELERILKEGRKKS